MKNFLYLIIILLALGCKNSEETVSFQNYLNETHSEELDNKVYVVLPLNLCGSCVKKITKIITSNVDHNDVIIILTDYTSVTINQVKKEFKGFVILEDNRMEIMNKKIVFADKIELIKVENNSIVDKIKYEVDYNEKEILSFLKD